MTTREYVGTGITVHWDSDRCFHSEHCTMGLPAVFDRTARPWVGLDGADPDRVAAVIDTCPSGALSYTRTDGAPNGRRGGGDGEDPGPSIAVDPSWTISPAAPGTTPVRITPLPDGQLAVEGPVALTQADGTVKVSQHWQLCRCGHSGTKPVCDGSHTRVGFTDPGAPPPATPEEARP
jgi:uncharacterized Fe-S cluster protein YjdI/CDGSH-type Zn-finger protein